MKKVTEIPPGYYDTAPNYTAERVDEMQELGLQLGDAHAEIRRQAKEIAGMKVDVIPAELFRQLRHYTICHLLNFPGCGAPTEAEIDAAIAQQKEME